jgi:acyl-CoA thioesterase FadM
VSGILSRWSVLREHTVATRDVDPAGAVHDAVVAGWIDDAVDAYLEQCRALASTVARAGLTLDRSYRPPDFDALTGRPATVVLTASATEYSPTSVTIALRIRSSGGDDDRALNVRCEVRALDATGAPYEFADDVRDELIALEHAARHFN